MKCPHCRVSFHDDPKETAIGVDADGGWILVRRLCPACKRMVLTLRHGPAVAIQGGGFILSGPIKESLVRPKAAMRPACPAEVPRDLAGDYNEACMVISDSSKASAALSRRCLQHLLREAAKVTPGDLASEIQQAIDSRTLPSHLVDSIDAIRNIGNFAAHPTKSKQSGEIVPVEPGEAEWNLDVLEALFDFYFVQPQLIRDKRAALDQKLGEAGKKPMK